MHQTTGSSDRFGCFNIGRMHTFYRHAYLCRNILIENPCAARRPPKRKTFPGAATFLGCFGGRVATLMHSEAAPKKLLHMHAHAHAWTEDGISEILETNSTQRLMNLGGADSIRYVVNRTQPVSKIWTDAYEQCRSTRKMMFHSCSRPENATKGKPSSS